MGERHTDGVRRVQWERERERGMWIEVGSEEGGGRVGEGKGEGERYLDRDWQRGRVGERKGEGKRHVDRGWQ